MGREPEHMTKEAPARRLGYRPELLLFALAYWTRFPVPDLSPSRAMRLPIGDSLADDPGLYWIVPMFGSAEPAHLVWIIALAAFAVALAWQPTWPLRIALALTAPWYIEPGAAYWVPAWAVWMALPASPRWAGAIAVLVTPFRAVASLPALASSFRSWRVGLVAVAGVAAVSLLGSHVLWHQLYIGLGWFPNPWGITYNDASGIVATTAPHASPEYEAALRSLFLAHVAEQPGWFALQLLAKLGAALSLALPWCLAVPFARRAWLPFLAALVPLVFVAPVPAYAAGLAAVGVYALGSGDYRRILSRLRMPRRADQQGEQQPAAGNVPI